MYRLLLYYLLMLVGVAMVFGAMGSLSYNPITILFSVSFAVAVCWLTNGLFARVYDVPSNPESSILTGLILALIITPQASMQSMVFLAAAGGLAIASKYILAINYKHIFNPVAIAVVLTALGPQESASWWVGSTVLLPFVIAGGLAVARKTCRGPMIGMFLATALIATMIGAVFTHSDIVTSLRGTLLHSSLFFLGFVMLTEPLTSPSARMRQLWYAAIVGVCFTPQLHVGSIYATPELALVIGNVASFLMTPRVRTLLRLTGRRRWGSATQDFMFKPQKPFSYLPGQYIELTLLHEHADARGSRRYFTLASSPTEDTLYVGVRFYKDGSSFKKALDALTEQTAIAAGQLGGDFTLPKDTEQKLAFIAGGIGVTPFRSMMKYMTDMNERRSTVMLYGERTADNVAYADVFEDARKRIGARTVYVINDTDMVATPNLHPGRITPSLIQTEIPDFAQRLFYVSGPQPMVQEVRRMLLGLGVSSSDIKTDYFSGYA
jgi:ferredoxin-NADP reductase/Na+-translocating ferredoxin:NAD+ oxidoreductase RnfD subunit